VSIYIHQDNSFEQSETVSRECPHCGAHAQLLPVATPSFEALSAYRPRTVGLAFRCAACAEPRFTRATVRAYGDSRIELSANLVEVERGREHFQFTYLPPPVERIFREALQCYTAGCYNAFASMCRRTVQTSLADLGANAKLRWHDLFREAVAIVDLDGQILHTLDTILFGADEPMPEIQADEAAVLVETIKDMVYQCYIRTAKLRAAMEMRRYFAAEQAGKITAIDRRTRRAESA
jgi:hypothetical protein